MAQDGGQKRPLDDPEEANGGALVAVKKPRQEGSLVVASKRPEIKAVRRSNYSRRREGPRACLQHWPAASGRRRRRQR